MKLLARICAPFAWRSFVSTTLEDTSKKLEAFIEGLKNKPSSKINSAQEARDAGLDEAYVMYRVLSDDAAATPDPHTR